MIKVKEYRGHIRNWKALCEELEIEGNLSREAREEAILIKAYQAWGCEMAMHMHGMFAFALWDEEEEKLFCLRDPFGTKPFYYYLTAENELLYGTMIRPILEQTGFVKEINNLFDSTGSMQQDLAATIGNVKDVSGKTSARQRVAAAVRVSPSPA